jgi:flavin reductase (DIM6/NTAB) family NADH-FMN oxidoreductase RutF
VIQTAPINAKILLAAVAPRPLVWVTTMSYDGGEVCIAPFSAITLVSIEPPLLLLIVQPVETGGRKKTALNAMETGEFVVNLLDKHHLRPLMDASEPRVRSEDRIDVAKVQFEPSQKVAVPHVANAVFSLECRVTRIDTLDRDIELIFAEIVTVFVSEAAKDEPPPFLGALGYEWFVSKEGISFIPQTYLDLD